MSFFTYVLRSINHNRFYKGHCENLHVRLGQHNSGKVKSTKAFAPWEVMYFEEYDTREDAVRREKYFKNASGRRWLKAKLEKPE